MSNKSIFVNGLFNRQGILIHAYRAEYFQPFTAFAGKDGEMFQKGTIRRFTKPESVQEFLDGLHYRQQKAKIFFAPAKNGLMTERCEEPVVRFTPVQTYRMENRCMVRQWQAAYETQTFTVSPDDFERMVVKIHNGGGTIYTHKQHVVRDSVGTLAYTNGGQLVILATGEIFFVPDEEDSAAYRVKVNPDVLINLHAAHQQHKFPFASIYLS